MTSTYSLVSWFAHYLPINCSHHTPNDFPHDYDTDRGAIETRKFGRKNIGTPTGLTCETSVYRTYDDASMIRDPYAATNKERLYFPDPTSLLMQSPTNPKDII